MSTMANTFLSGPFLAQGLGLGLQARGQDMTNQLGQREMAIREQQAQQQRMLFNQDQGDRAAMGQNLPTLASSMGAFTTPGGFAADGSGPPAPDRFNQDAADAFGKLPPQAMPGMLREMTGNRREQQYEQDKTFDRNRTMRLDQQREADAAETRATEHGGRMANYMLANSLGLPFEDGGSSLLQTDSREGRMIVEQTMRHKEAMDKVQRDTMAKQRVAQSIIQSATARAEGIAKLRAQGYDTPQMQQEEQAARAMAEMAAAGAEISPHELLDAVKMPHQRDPGLEANDWARLVERHPSVVMSKKKAELSDRKVQTLHNQYATMVASGVDTSDKGLMALQAALDKAEQQSADSWKEYADTSSKIEDQVTQGAGSGLRPQQMTPMQPYTRPGGGGMARDTIISRPRNPADDGDIEKQLIAFRDEQRKKGVPDSQIRAKLADEYKRLTGTK